MLPFLGFASIIVFFVFTIRAWMRRSSKKPGKNWVWVLASFVLFWVAAANSPSSTSPSTQEASSSDTPTDAPVAATDADSVSHNWSADIGGLQFNIMNVAVHSMIGNPDNEYEQETAKGEFVVVQLQVANHSHKSATVSGTDFHLERDGQEYDATTSMATMGDGFEFTQINPGLQHTAAVAFDVPSSTSAGKYTLEVYGNGTDGSQDKMLISLAKTD